MTCNCFPLFIQTTVANSFCTVGKKNARNVVSNTADHLVPLSHSHWKQHLSVLFGAVAMNDFKRRRPDLYKYINRVNSQCCSAVYWSSFWVFNASNGHRLFFFPRVSHVKPKGFIGYAPPKAGSALFELL